jgi:hypothetical protein
LKSGYHPALFLENPILSHPQLFFFDRNWCFRLRVRA